MCIVMLHKKFMKYISVYQNHRLQQLQWYVKCVYCNSAIDSSEFKYFIKQVGTELGQAQPSWS